MKKYAEAERDRLKAAGFNAFVTTKGGSSAPAPEQIKVGQVNSVENYPTDIPYADMSHNTPDVKEALLAKWEH